MTVKEFCRDFLYNDEQICIWDISDSRAVWEGTSWNIQFASFTIYNEQVEHVYSDVLTEEEKNSINDGTDSQLVIEIRTGD